MRPIFNKHILLALLGSSVLLSSCKKDKAEPVTDVVYIVNVDGYTATFTNQTSGAQSYRWDFGDGGNASSANPTHTFAAAGIYTVSLTAVSNNGCRDSIKIVTTIYAEPQAAFSVSAEACLGTELNLQIKAAHLPAQ